MKEPDMTETTTAKTVTAIMAPPARGHWVGDGFPVRSLFSYARDPAALSPFLLFDHAGPYDFTPNTAKPRGVGAHPHRGFETVTIVYDGEVSHRDSAGGGGTIGAGDVQWMTAAGGVLHDEFHSPAFSRSGGPFHMVQLWVNLPASEKMGAPRYQAITAGTIPEIVRDGSALRIIAGESDGTRGPAQTFTPVNLWDLRLAPGASRDLVLPAGHTSLIAVLAGEAVIAGTMAASGSVVQLSREGSAVVVSANQAAHLLVLTGEPIDEPVVGHGPFVMNSAAEIATAIADFDAGRFGTL